MIPMREGFLLPRLLVLTDRGRSEERGRTLGETVRAALAGGARAVVLREKDLPEEERARLGGELLEALVPAGAALIVASDRHLAERLGVVGVHLAAAEPWDPIRDPGMVTGRSCHSTEELLRAAQTGADYVTLSPVFRTDSKPGYGPALGPKGLSQLLQGPAGASRPLPPVFALGGVTPDRVEACLRSGAYGVAVMGAVMGADDPARTVSALVERLPRPEEVDG